MGDEEERAHFQERFQRDVLTRVPEWSGPGPTPIVRRRRPETAPRWRLFPALAVVTAAALVVGLYISRQGTATPGMWVLRREWPAGFNGHAHLALSSGLLVLTEGRRAVAFRTDYLKKPLWTHVFSGNAQILAAGTSPVTETLLVVRISGRTYAILVEANGRVLATTRLYRTAASPSAGWLLPIHLTNPHGPFWVRPGPGNGFLLSDRSTTYVVDSTDRIRAIVPGGRGSFLTKNAAGSQAIISCISGRVTTVYVSNLTGRRALPQVQFQSQVIETVSPPQGGAAIIPVNDAAGFVLHYGSKILEISQSGLSLYGSSPSGPLSADAHLVNTTRGTRLVVWDESSMGIQLPLLRGYRGLGILDASGVVVAVKDGDLYALRPDGRVLATAQGSPISVVPGSHYAFVATASGVVRLGPFGEPGLPAQMIWTGSQGYWRVSAVIRPVAVYTPYLADLLQLVTGPIGTPYSQRVFAQPPLPPYGNINVDLADVLVAPVPRPLVARVSVRYTGPYAAQFNRVGSAEPPWWGWGLGADQSGTAMVMEGPHSLTQPHAPPGFTETSYMPYNRLAWMAMAAGWVKLPRQIPWHLSFVLANAGNRTQITVTLVERYGTRLQS